jgi:hypothetical protein
MQQLCFKGYVYSVHARSLYKLEHLMENIFVKEVYNRAVGHYTSLYKLENSL